MEGQGKAIYSLKTQDLNENDLSALWGLIIGFVRRHGDLYFSIDERFL